MLGVGKGVLSTVLTGLAYSGVCPVSTGQHPPAPRISAKSRGEGAAWCLVQVHSPPPSRFPNFFPPQLHRRSDFPSPTKPIANEHGRPRERGWTSALYQLRDLRVHQTGSDMPSTALAPCFPQHEARPLFEVDKPFSHWEMPAPSAEAGNSWSVGRGSGLARKIGIN